MKKYKDKGLEILGFPCNPICKSGAGHRRRDTFLLPGKFRGDVPPFQENKSERQWTQTPLYVYLKEQAKGALGSSIKWNFTKFLVDRNGNVLNRYEIKDNAGRARQHSSRAAIANRMNQDHAPCTSAGGFYFKPIVPEQAGKYIFVFT